MCPENVTIVADGERTNVSWPEPIFYDAQGSDIKVTSTFGTNTTSLSWGEQRVEYTATNTYNNRTTFCVFHIDVFRKSYRLHGKCMHSSIIVFVKVYYTDIKYRGYDKCSYTFLSPQTISRYSYWLFFVLPPIIYVIPLIRLFNGYLFYKSIDTVPSPDIL